MDNDYSSKFPFLTGIVYAGIEYVGIVTNCDAQLVTFYDISEIQDANHKLMFLELGETWWWESNRLLPIEIFLPIDMHPFSYCLKTFAMRDVQVMFGPMTSLQTLLNKRIKRRSIQLVRNPPK
jgi:hypothetical protein